MPRTVKIGDNVEWRTAQSGLIARGTVQGFNGTAKTEIVMPDMPPLPSVRALVNLTEVVKVGTKDGQQAIPVAQLFVVDVGSEVAAEPVV